MNISRCPRVTALHPADLKLGDSGAIVRSTKYCMDAKARYTPLANSLLGFLTESRREATLIITNLTYISKNEDVTLNWFCFHLLNCT